MAPLDYAKITASETWASTRRIWLIPVRYGDYAFPLPQDRLVDCPRIVNHRVYCFVIKARSNGILVFSFGMAFSGTGECYDCTNIQRRSGSVTWDELTGCAGWSAGSSPQRDAFWATKQ